MAEWKLEDAEGIRASLTKQQEDNISMLYRQAYLQARKQFLAIPANGTASQQIERQYLKKLMEQLDEAYKSIGIGLEKEVKKNAKKAAQAVVNSNAKQLAKYGFSIEGAYSYVPKDIVNALVSGQVYSGSWSLSGAIWTDVTKHQSDIGKIVAAGVASQKSAYDIAKDLEQYINPSAKKPWDWSKVYPGTSKKVDYNAQRLARTMVSHAYQQSLERVCNKNPFVEGYIWMSSNSSRVCQLCKDRDGKFFKKGELPLDHPNGMCTFEADIPKSMDEIGEELAEWAKGNDNPKLDAWYQDMTGNSPQPVFSSLQDKWLKPLGFTPENMPATFYDFASKLDYSQQSELLKLAGTDWSNPHPFQAMEAYYKQHLQTVRMGVVPLQSAKNANVSGVTMDTIKAMFAQQNQGYTTIDDLTKDAADWWGKLSQEERRGVEQYTSNLYVQMNKYLRGINTTASSSVKDAINNCKSALEQASCPFDIVVGRGSDAISLNAMLGGISDLEQAARSNNLATWIDNNRDKVINQVASDAGFLSTTPSSSGGFSGEITYRILVPQGSKGAYVDAYSVYQGEKEFLLQCGGAFRVVDVETGTGNNATVFMEYLG